MTAGAGPAGAAGGGGPEANKALVRRYIEAVWHEGAPVAQFFTPGYQRHLSPALPPLTGAEQEARVAAFRRAFPDLRFTVEELVAEGDRVVFRATIRGTHLGPFRGVAPTGRRIAGAVLDVVRVEGGRFAEHWGGPDLWDLLRQLGEMDA